jgi:hypothetical protein
MSSHFLTTSEAEKSDAVKSGFVFEGIIGYIHPFRVEQSVPLFRLFKRSHFFSSSLSDLKTWIRNGYVLEGVSGYVMDSSISGSVPLYVMKRNEKYLYAVEIEEFASLAGQGWIPEGIAGHIFSIRKGETVPLYRLRRAKNGFTEVLLRCFGPVQDHAEHKHQLTYAGSKPFEVAEAAVSDTSATVHADSDAGLKSYESMFQHLSDVEFIYMLAIGRKPTAFEVEHEIDIRRLIATIPNTAEFEFRNPRSVSLINAGKDVVIKTDAALVKRAYQLIFDREPTSEEAAPWLSVESINPVALASTLFRMPEYTKLYGASRRPDGDKSAERNALQLKVNIINQDIYSEYVLSRQSTERRRVDKLLRLRKKELRIALNAFEISDDDLNRIVECVDSLHGVSLNFEIASLKQLANDPGVGRFDIFLTNSNHVAVDIYQNYQQMAEFTCLTACWHWDNHHLVGFNHDLASHFDVIFPAHSTNHTSLHGGKAIVGSVTPCCVFQWSSGEAERYYEQFREGHRSNELYGRFNSYEGRCALRDIFLKKASSVLGLPEVHVIAAADNKFLHQPKDERFKELSGFKAIICNSIYNDVPARLFDALLVGAIPIVPFGLPDLGNCFNWNVQNTLPIVTYAPDNIASLRSAIDFAVAKFDEGAGSAALTRHRSIVDAHFLHHRLTAMISELISLARH